jgi:hypothetical protein
MELESGGNPMSDAVLERKTGVIEYQHQAIGEELQSRENDGNWQSLVWSANAIGYEWRSVVALLSSGAGPVDYRALYPALAPLANASLAIFDTIVAQIGDLVVDGKSDLLLSRHELSNIVRWISTWPKPGGERRRRIRQEVSAGEFVTTEQFAAN